MYVHMYYGYIMMRAIVVCPNLLCMYLCVCTFVCFVCSYVMLVSSALQFCFVYFSYALWILNVFLVVCILLPFTELSLIFTDIVLFFLLFLFLFFLFALH